MTSNSIESSKNMNLQPYIHKFKFKEKLESSLENS